MSVAQLPFSEEWLFKRAKSSRMTMCQGQLRATIKRRVGRRKQKHWEYYCAHCGRSVAFERPA